MCIQQRADWFKTELSPWATHAKSGAARRGDAASFTFSSSGGYNYDLTLIRRSFDCLSEVIKVSDVAHYPQSRCSSPEQKGRNIEWP